MHINFQPFCVVAPRLCYVVWSENQKETVYKDVKEVYENWLFQSVMKTESHNHD